MSEKEPNKQPPPPPKRPALNPMPAVPEKRSGQPKPPGTEDSLTVSSPGCGTEGFGRSRGQASHVRRRSGSPNGSSR